MEIAGSGRMRVTTAEDVPVVAAPETLERSDLFDTQVADFWANLAMSTGASNPTLLERVWVANRCLQMNSNAISTMPLRHYGTRTPAWVSNPDPVWFPNGISDAVFAIVWSLYGWGDAFVYVTARYADGYPSAWTVLDPAPMVVESRRGRRTYRSGQVPLGPADMVQISRDPRGVRGTSAISSYAAYTNGLLAAADMGRVMMTNGVPNAVLQSTKKLDEPQARKIQDQWVTATAARRGAPPVLPPELTFQQLSFSPADLMLLDAQKLDAQVIATAYGVPALMLNLSVDGGLNYQTPVLLLEQWWRTELRTTASRISQALSGQMLPAGQYVEFDPYKFLAPAWKDLVDGWALMVEKGLATQEEFRTVVLGLPPAVQEQTIEALSTPPSAGASPAQQPGSVVPLRPTSSSGVY